MRPIFLKLIVIIFLWIIVGLGSAPNVQAQDEQALDIDRLQRATVAVIQGESVNGQWIRRCIGSGTIIDRQGLIATNAHNTAPNLECPGDTIFIAVNVDNESPPIVKYRAEIAQVDLGLDLALLRITAELNGRLIEPGSLFLPFVELADSDDVLLDDTITVVGYPDIIDAPIDTAIGTVSGFVSEPSGGNRSWIKTNASIPGAMTGGGVYNEASQLIGMPTTVPISALGTANCTTIDDTNGDGLINTNDGCVPVGDFINALRPSNFIQPLLRSAALGVSVRKLSEPTVPTIATGAPEFSRLIISTSVTNGQPTSVVQSLPTGATSVFLFFDYTNMTPETIYELLVSRDNVPDPRFSLAPVRWSGGRNGSWYIGSRNVIWPPGNYTFELFINGRASGALEIIIGRADTERPTFRNIAFGISVPDQDGLIGTGNVLPVTNNVTATFIHQNMTPELTWTSIWYYNGVEQDRNPTQNWSTAEQLPDSVAQTRIASDLPLPTGQYRLELYIAGVLAARADFIIAGELSGAVPNIFNDTRFYATDDPLEIGELNPATSFSNTVEDIFTLFNWQQIGPGTLWRMRWTVDDIIFYDQVAPWFGTQTGQDYITMIDGTGRIPDGTYSMELIVNDIIIEREEFEIGIGQLPIDQFAQAVGVQLNGQIIDAETSEPIPGASFIILTEDWSVQDWIWDQTQVYDLAITDRNGRFQINRLLQFGAPYSVIIAADGYLQVNADGVLVTPESDNPTEVVVPLTRER